MKGAKPKNGTPVEPKRLNAAGTEPLLTGILLVCWGVVVWLLWGSLYGNDLWFHIRAGLVTMAGNTGWPLTDSFTFTFAGQTTDAGSWLGGVILASIWWLGGEPGLLFGRILANLCILFLGDRMLAKRDAPFALRATILLLGGFALHGRTLRPWLLAAVLLMALAVLLQEMLQRPKRCHVLGVWTLLLLWVNIHPSFPLAGALLLPAFICLTLDRRDFLKTPWGILLLLSPLAFLIHPTPFAQLEFIDRGVSGFVQYRPDWLPVRLWPIRTVTRGILVGTLTLTTGTVVWTLIATRMRNVRTVLACGTSVILMFWACSAVRFQWLVAFALYLAAWEYARSRATVQNTTQSRLAERWSVVAHPLGYLLLIVLATTLVEHKSNYSIRHGRPAEACRFLAETELEGRAFSLLGWSGQILLARWPDVRVFLDGRVLEESDEIDREYYQILRCGTEMEALLERHKIDLIVVPESVEPRWLGRMPGRWIPVHYDGTASIYLRTGEPNANLSRVAAYYQELGIPFDAERGLCLEDLASSNPLVTRGAPASQSRVSYTASLAEARDESNPVDVRAQAYHHASAIAFQTGAFIDATDHAEAGLALTDTAKLRETYLYCAYRIGVSDALQRVLALRETS